jgi:hypothetical protein
LNIEKKGLVLDWHYKSNPNKIDTKKDRWENKLSGKQNYNLLRFI